VKINRRRNFLSLRFDLTVKIGTLILVFVFGASPLSPAQTSSQPSSPDTPRIAELTTMIQQQPANSSAWEERGHAYALLGQRDRALADLNKAVSLAPNDDRLLRHTGWTLFNLREFKSALQFWLRAAQISGGQNGPDNYTVALGYWGMQDLTRAAAYYNRAVAVEKSFGRWKTLEQRVDFWTDFERHAIYEVFDAWRRGYKEHGDE
jgi:tetratricopeptide (TPR) repeat protein